MLIKIHTQQDESVLYICGSYDAITESMRVHWLDTFPADRIPKAVESVEYKAARLEQTMCGGSMLSEIYCDDGTYFTLCDPTEGDYYDNDGNYLSYSDYLNH